MNKKQLMNQRWNALKKVRVSNRVKNVMRESTNNTFEHEDMKWRVYWYCRKQGWDVITEAIFESGKRADIYILDHDIVVEILHTETKAKFLKKIEGYPVPTVIPVRSDENFNGDMIF